MGWSKTHVELGPDPFLRLPGAGGQEGEACRKVAGELPGMIWLAVCVREEVREITVLSPAPAGAQDASLSRAFQIPSDKYRDPSTG